MEGGGAWDTGLPLDAVTEARAQRFRTLLEAGPLPTSEQLNRIEARTEARREKIPALELEAGDIRSDIARVEADIARINRDMPNADMLIGQLTRVKNSLEVELEGVEAEIQNVETELEKATERSEELGKALKEIGGLEAAPEINMESIEAAMEKLREFRAAYRRALGPVPIVDGRVSDNYVPTPRPKPRATGGPVRTGMPYLVNENTPRSEWFVPSRSGGILKRPAGAIGIPLLSRRKHPAHPQPACRRTDARRTGPACRQHRRGHEHHDGNATGSRACIRRASCPKGGDESGVPWRYQHPRPRRRHRSAGHCRLCGRHPLPAGRRILDSQPLRLN